MPAKQPKSRDEQYTRAAQIAKRDGLIVKAVQIGDETVYVVVRPVNMSVHIVRREPVGLTCDAACASTKFGNYCEHRAAVRLHLLAEVEAEQPVSAPAPAPVQHDRETAPIVNNRGFSIWRS